MLKGNLRLHDLVTSPVLVADRLIIGSGYVAPFANQALESFLVTTDDQWLFVVRERMLGVHKPPTNSAINFNRYRSIYKNCLEWPFDYVMIEVAPKSCTMEIRAGTLGSAPIYIQVIEDNVLISWDFADFINRSTVIDFEIIARLLCLETIYSYRQPCVGVTLLTERSSIHIDPQGVLFRYPRQISLPAMDTQNNNALSGDTLRQMLTECLRWRHTARKKIAVELSGGMDSALAALISKDVSRRVHTFGILLGEDTGHAQMHRRDAITRVLKLQDFTVSICDHLPSVSVQAATRAPEHLLGEFYLEAFQALWAEARAHCSVIVSGIGGDELFPLFEDEDANQSTQSRSPARIKAYSLLTKRARDAVRAHRVYDAPSSPVPATALLAHVHRSPYLLRSGLWPINPLSDPQVVAYCHSLPLYTRQGRVLMRSILDGQLGPSVFPADYMKETFKGVLTSLIERDLDVLLYELRDCALADLGIVDIKCVRALLLDSGSRRDAAASTALAFFLNIERFVRQVGG